MAHVGVIGVIGVVKVFKFIAKLVATNMIFGKIYNWLKPNFFIILFPMILIFLAFYIPYEYEKYLIFKNKFPNDQIGVYLNLLRPVIILIVFIFVSRFFYIQKQRIKKEKIEQLEKIEREKKEKIEREQASLERIKKFKEGAVAKSTEKVVTKENVGAAAGGVAGGIIGSSIGIAGFGTAIAGTLPVAIVGAALGYLGMKLWKKNKSKDDGK